MELIQARFVTDDVPGLAAFYARLVRTTTALNDYYVEVQAGPASVGFSRRRFTECPAGRAGRADLADPVGLADPAGPRCPGAFILDFQADDADAEYPRIAALGVDWVMRPATQPWGSRSMIFRDPQGNLINVFSRGGDSNGH
jgi:predicted enzyme related to lactoylglutathione lyase